MIEFLKALAVLGAWWQFPSTDRPKRLFWSPLTGPERLEDRCVLTGGLLDWAQVGPFPQINPTPNGGVRAGEATSGRISSLAFGMIDTHRTLFLGSASGGVWRSTNYNAATPTWTPLSDFFAATATDPNNTGRNG